MSLFKSQTGLFSDVPCPLGEKCSLGNCFYSHKRSSATKRTLERESATRDTGNVPKKQKPTERADSKPELLIEDLNKPLTPEVITNAPAQHRQRVQFVNVIRDKLVENGYGNANARAIEIESAVAQRCTQFTYAMGIRSAVREITTKQLDSEADRANQAAIDDESTYRKELVNLLAPVRELEKARYVLSKPDAAELESTKVMPCARCSTTFPIYSPASTTTSCRFHLLKRVYDPAIKRLSPLFPCCGESLEESSGCETRPFHVYKFDSPSEMEAVIPFRETPEPGEPRGQFAVGLDCEMAWTTKGFELIRVTVVSYEQRKTVFDRLVWPIGKILDLNTRFSGVKDMNDGTMVDGKKLPALTLEEMYTELFKIVDAKTIIIGHGLVNDMNALRLIHHRIVDTAILYPRIRNRTFSLKELAWDFLSRTIQVGEHDSMEDSLAAIDIVRKDIKNRCFKGKVKSFS